LTLRHPRRIAPLLLLAAAAGCARGPRTFGPVRHVVFVSLDTTRADQLGPYGNTTVRTPQLDRLAAESIVLDDFATVVPTTLASHTTLFSGQYPHTHGIPGNGFVVPPETALLPELLRDAGFTTAAFVSSFALGRRFGLDQGFDVYDDAVERLAGRDGVMQNERSAAAVTDAALAWLDQAGTPPNLFLFVHYFDPHVPYEPPAPYDTLYDPRGRAGLPDWAAVAKPCSEQPGEADENERRMALQYAGELSYLDEHLGRLIDGLRGRGILDKALLVLTSDHGENFWEHPGCFDHGWNNYEATLRIAGILRLPAARAGGRRVGAPLANIDILPTVLGFMGLTPPEGMEGQALDLERLTGPAPDRPRFAQATKPWRQEDARAGAEAGWINQTKTRSVRRGRHKLIQTPWAGTEELYDLDADPGERRDLLAAEPAAAAAVARELRPLLEAWAGSAHPRPARFEISQQEETIRRLRALGYLGGH